MPGDGGDWVQVDIIDASLPMAVEDIVAALWLAAERDDLNPADAAGPNADAFAVVARPVVLYLLLTDHAGILAARAQLAALRPGTHLWDLAGQIRAYAADLFLPGLDGDIPDTIPEDFENGGEGW